MLLVDLAFAAPAPVRVASYGANGTHWPSLIPTPFLYDDTVPNIINVACTWRAISNAIISVTPAQAAAGLLIRVAPGTLAGNGAGAGNAAVLKNIGSSSWSQRITVCPRDGYGTIVFSGGVRLINVRGVCFAGLTGDSIKLEGCDGSALAWTKVASWLAGYGLAGQATANVEYCEVVIPDSAVNDGDASDFYAVSTGPLTNWVFEACYIAPRFFNPATAPKPHTDTLQFAGSCSRMAMRDLAIFASNNCALQTGGIANLILIHSYIVAGDVARSRYPFLPGGSTESGIAAFNGGGTDFSATDSVFIGGAGSTTWAYVSNTRTSYAYAASQQPANGSWTVDTTLSATNPPMPPYPTDTYLDSIWNNHGQTITNVPPAITSSPQNGVVPQDLEVTFAVTATGTEPLSYQWRLDGQPLVGASGTNCTVTSAQCTNAGSYDVVVTNAGGNITSSVAVLTVVSPPLLVYPPTNQSVLIGQAASFSVTATNDCGGAPAYQWLHAGTNLAGATATSLNITNAQASNEGPYTVVVTNLGGSLTSAVATLTFNGPPAISSSPAAQFLVRGADALFSVRALGSAPLAYQWRHARVPLADATNSVWTRTNVQCGDIGGYDVVVTNALGSVTSSLALLAVASPPDFVSLPTDQTVAVGQTAAFSVSATNDCGSAPTYQWQHAGTNLAGATARTLTITGAQTADAGAYTAVARNFGGALTSAVATLTVLVPPAISSGPTNQLSVAGANVLFSVTATGSAPLGYQWRLAGVVVADATDSDYARTNIQCGDAGAYEVIVTNAGGGVTSSVALLRVVSPPLLAEPPTNQTIIMGQPAIFSVTATNDCGGGLAYQWRLNGADLLDATNSALFRTNAQPEDVGCYTVVITNFAGAVTSSVATLEVTTPSLLVLTPSSLDFGTAFSGSTASASFVVSNAGVGFLSGTATILGGPFTIEGGNGVGLSVSALSATNLMIQFTPPTAGVFSNAIVFTTDGGSATNSLYGVGADLPIIPWTAQAGSNLVFCFPTISGRTYTIEYEDSLDSQTWLPLQSFAGDGSANFFTNSTTMPSQRFYRLSAH